jgi:hypothetical protein
MKFDHQYTADALIEMAADRMEMPPSISPPRLCRQPGTAT